MKITPEELVAVAAEAMEDKRGKDVAVLDLRGLTVMTDYFVVASAETAVQVRAIGEGVVEALAERGAKYRRREGWDDARWVLLDYGDLVVHIFHQAEREFYSLERLWGDAVKLTPEEAGKLQASQD